MDDTQWTFSKYLCALQGSAIETSHRRTLCVPHTDVIRARCVCASFPLQGACPFSSTDRCSEKHVRSISIKVNRPGAIKASALQQLHFWGCLCCPGHRPRASPGHLVPAPPISPIPGSFSEREIIKRFESALVHGNVTSITPKYPFIMTNDFWHTSQQTRTLIFCARGWKGLWKCPVKLSISQV